MTRAARGERPGWGTPPGWSYNPSAWGERWPVLLLALAGLVIAAYLTAFQLGYFASVWDPFFGNGTREVLTSRVAGLLPIPDAALGALGYLTDALSGVIGGARRWRDMPWIVVLFGLAVGPLGAVSLLLVMAQPLVVGHFCTLCLASALISVLMIGPAMDELLASLQYLRQVRARGGSVWNAFFHGRG